MAVDDKTFSAALECSYALEGVMDNRSLNYVVAHRLLDDFKKYQEHRGYLSERVSSSQLALMDAHHKIFE